MFLFTEDICCWRNGCELAKELKNICISGSRLCLTNLQQVLHILSEYHAVKTLLESFVFNSFQNGGVMLQNCDSLL